MLPLLAFVALLPVPFRIPGFSLCIMPVPGIARAAHSSGYAESGQDELHDQEPDYEEYDNTETVTHIGCS